MNYNFNNKIALVTGGTSGIGKEISKQLLIHGAKVIINYAHNEENYEQTRKELAEYKENVMFIKADVSNEDEVIKMFEKVLNVNLIGKVICTKHAIPLLKNSKTPSIVNIASRLGTRPCVESSAYCSAEAGIINFTRSKCIRAFKIFNKS